MLQLQSASQRALAIIRSLDPVCLADVLLEFASVVQSQFWDGRRTGPDFISPMASLTKRQSGHLAKLIFQHSNDLLASKPDNPDILCHQDETVVHGVPLHNSDSGTASVQEYVEVHPQTVAVLDLANGQEGQEDQRPQKEQEIGPESQYATPAEIDLMVLVPILCSFLVILRTHQWSPSAEFIVIDFIAALILGPGTLTLIRRTSLHPVELDPDLGCAVLMDDDIVVVIQGSQRIVEAITEGGFYLSLADSQILPRAEDPSPDPVTERWQEKQVVSDILHGTLEGGCRGASEVIVMRFLHLYFSFPHLREMAYVLAFGRTMGHACWWGLKASINDSLAPVSGVTPLRSVARLTGEFLGLLTVVACITSASSSTILLHGVSFFVQSSYFGLFARLVLQSQNYLIRPQRLLNALRRPVIRKWAFRTRASAATFVSLVLCRNIPRPVRTVHIHGVLDTLIPDQREVWRAWKDRVADRIVHQGRIAFTPTIPTFPDSKRQKRLKDLLDEAQTAHDRFYHFYLSKSG
ncbi:hypothetical protein JVU11DRAFT_53 [Chiua virens]|nr:hypothetical protein JVU11DRAFT_53 [Chiua virens]